MAHYQSRGPRGKPDLDFDGLSVGSARSVPIETVLRARGLRFKRQAQYLVGPCPRCGGHDRFNVHLKKQSWFCRRCDTGGGVIQLVMHIDGCEFCDLVEALCPAPRYAYLFSRNARPRWDGHGDECPGQHDAPGPQTLASVVEQLSRVAAEIDEAGQTRGLTEKDREGCSANLSGESGGGLEILACLDRRAFRRGAQ
jgi:CHC2 zinc finger